MRNRLTLAGYYEGTWSLMILWLFLLGVASDTVTYAVLLPGFVLTVLAGKLFFTRFSVPRWLNLCFFFLASAVGVWAYSLDKDVVWIFSHTLVGFLPFGISRREILSGYWTALTAVVVLGLVCLLVGDGPSEFILFIVLASTLVFSLNAAHLYFYVGSAEAAVRRVPSHYFFPFLVSVSLGLVVGISLFVFFPRAIQWTNPFGMREKQASTTGYSGNISLGGVSIEESQTVAVTLEVTDRAWLKEHSATLLLRGNALEQFDGTRWSNRRSNTIPYQSPRDFQSTGSYEAKFIQGKIYREPHSTLGILVPGVVHELNLPRFSLGMVRVDENGNLTRSSREETKYSYGIAFSAPARPPSLKTLSLKDLHAQLKTVEGTRFSFSKTPEDFERFLEVPPEVAHADYFVQWRKEVLSGNAPTTVSGVLSRLVGHFRSNFRVGYQSAEHNVDSLETFLSKGRYGHCEYFATSSVMFLRSMGIPARIALGYRGGVFNEISQVLQVREANAHAWVEVFLPKAGWMTLDPTPMLIRSGTAPWFEQVQVYASAVKFWFQRYVVDYNGQTQASLYRDIRDAAVKRKDASKASLAVWGWAVLFGLVAFLFYAAVRRWRRRALRTTAATLPSYYLEFLRLVRKAGWFREAGETYARFHQRLSRSGRFTDLVGEIDKSLERDLYSPEPLSKDARRRLLASIRLLGLIKPQN